MFNDFKAFMLSKAPFTEDELELVRSLSFTKKLRKHQYLLQEGDVCNTKTFVAKGLLRAYVLRQDGNEHIMRFAPENTWMIDHESYTFGTPSKYFIDALEDTEIVCWTKDNMQKIFDALPVFRMYSEELKERSMNESQQRILANISYTTQEKYEAFVASYPNVFSRVPLHMVASYLGVSRETLSRVRHSQYERERKKSVG